MKLIFFAFISLSKYKYTLDGTHSTRLILNRLLGRFVFLAFMGFRDALKYAQFK